MLHGFDFLAEQASWIDRILKCWRHEKKIQILKFEDLDWYSPNLVWNISQFAQVGKKQIFNKFEISKNLNASIEFGEVLYQRSLIDILDLCAV